MPSVVFTLLALVILSLTSAPITVLGGVVELTLQSDTRRVIDLGVFGYAQRGVSSLTVTGLSLGDKSLEATPDPIGFTLDKVFSANSARQERNAARSDDASRICFIDIPQLTPANASQRRLVPLQQYLRDRSNSVKGVNSSFTIQMEVLDEGLYALFFYNCKQLTSTVPVSLKVVWEAYNIGITGQRDYIGVGMRHASEVYYCFSAIYVILILLWVREWRRNAAYVHRIHYAMSLLLLFKFMTVFFEGMKFRGHMMSGSLSAWDVFYYIFLTLKAVALFGVILLLGSGWSLLKPFLSDRDKKTLMIVLPLQVVVNIAIAVIEEKSEGNTYWSNWYDLLHVLDIVCCCCILLPLVWSIKSLRDAADVDGKVQRNLGRLRQFRTFYIVVVAYIYYTRIGVVTVETYLDYSHQWIAYLVHECGSVLFYTFIGFKFRPQPQSDLFQSEEMEELQVREELGPV